MSYKLADGSDSNLYEVGDFFEKTGNYDTDSAHSIGDTMKLLHGEDEIQPYFKTIEGSQDYRYMGCHEFWENLMPTHETKLAVDRRNESSPTMQTLEASQQQPCVPIQFIWCEGQLHPASDAINIAFTGDSCEQIGAVLYVRSEK